MGLVVTALAAMLVSSCGGGGGQEDDSAADTTTAGGGGEQGSTADLDAALKKAFQQSSAPGVVAAVQTPEYTWIRALGVADRTSEEPMTPEMYHRIGSVTKTFTATLLLQAEAEGLLSLDDTIDQYIKGVPNGDEITLRQLANMTSGVATYSETKKFDGDPGADPYRVWKPEELAKIGIEDSPLFDPGTEFNYSNTNYVLLGLVLEQVTGEAHRRAVPPNRLSNRSASKTPPSPTSRIPPCQSRTPRATPSKANPPAGSPETLPIGTRPGHGLPA